MTFGSPSLLYIYHRDEGRLKETTDLILKDFYLFAANTGGCGLGCDSLARAEYALETGRFEEVEKHAYRAMYKARAGEQTGTVICAMFVLLRLMNYEARFEEELKLMDEVRSEIERENNPVFLSAFDMCDAYIKCCLNKADALPQWMREGDLSAGTYMFSGISVNYIVYEKCLLTLGDHLKADAMCEMFPQYNMNIRSQMGALYNKVHEAAAKKAIDGPEVCREVLLEALRMGGRDGIIMPFVENSRSVADELREIRRDRAFEDEAYLDRILQAADQYGKATAQYEGGKEILSPREQEIMALLAEGDKHAAIAEKLFISTATVRFHIRNLYDKLGVNNKVAMIRRARDMHLIE